MNRTLLIIISIFLSGYAPRSSDGNYSQKKQIHLVIPNPRKKMNGVTSSIDSLNLISKKLIGIWVARNFDTPTFEFRKTTIYYFRDASTVPYKLTGDSIHIFLDKKVEPHPIYLLTIKGMDILIFTTNDGYKSIAYRYKKSKR